MSYNQWSASALFVFLLADPAAMRAQSPRQKFPVYDPNSRVMNASPPAEKPVPHSSSQQNGSSCTLVTFEGLANLQAIPTFQGISFPNWQALLDNSPGAHVKNEPSLITVAFWYNYRGTSVNILLPNNAYSVSFYYASYNSVTLTAYDSNNNTLATANGNANWDSNPFPFGSYDTWAQLSVKAPMGKSIASINITGQPNFLAIDNLNVCQTPMIDSVEITQAIQQYQTLDDLQNTLKNNGGDPPVPIVSGKNTAMRVYFQEVQDVTPVTVHLIGPTDQTKTITVQPNCPDMNQRTDMNGCQSMDFYFTAPSGSWTATLDQTDDSGNILNTTTLNLQSHDTVPLVLKGVTVCDGTPPKGCTSGTILLNRMTLLTKLAPTNSVQAVATNLTAVLPTAGYAQVDPINPALPSWWQDAARTMDIFYAMNEKSPSSYVTYMGMVNPNLANSTAVTGLADALPSHGAVAKSSTNGLNSFTNNSTQNVAHETFHTLGLHHTNKAFPGVSGNSGCYDLARDPGTPWPYSNNFLQSGPAGSPQREVGFDVAAQRPLNSDTTYEIMGYCIPGWSSPQYYSSLISALGAGEGASAAAANAQSVTGTDSRGPSPAVPPQHSPRPLISSSNSSPAWLVSGIIVNGAVTFDPLFQLTVPGSTLANTGNYTLTLQDSSGHALFTQPFTPNQAPMEIGGSTAEPPPSFDLLVPVMANAAAIVVTDPNSVQLGRIALGGIAPTVAITSPAIGFTGSGTQNVAWTVAGSGQSNLWARVWYSVDSGTTWSEIGQTQNSNSLAIDFDTLPGSTQSLIQVIVSDGVNTGSATSPPFTVPAKTPTLVGILTPDPDAVLAAVNPVYLSGTAYDPDDGALTGSALAWSSNLQGSLGTGSSLSVSLQPGNHVITLTATDSDNNSISTTTNLTMAGAPPAVTVTATPQNTGSNSCETIRINAQPGVNGAALSVVQASVDGGFTFMPLSLASLPYTFIAPGQGFLHIVASATDASNQSNAADVTFLTSGTCQQAKCNVTANFGIAVNDVQQMINEALGLANASDDLNGDGVVNIQDVQLEIIAAMTGSCLLG
jgi:hypothetical protein